MFRSTSFFIYVSIFLTVSSLASPQPPGGFGAGCDPLNSASCITSTSASSSSTTSSSTPSSSSVTSTPSPNPSDPSSSDSDSNDFSTDAVAAAPSIATSRVGSETSPTSSTAESSQYGSNGSGGSSSSGSSPYGGSNGGSGSPYGAGSNSGFSFSSLPIFSKLSSVLTAHAVLACLAWALFFPLGGIIIRILRSRHLVWLHAALQIFAYAMFTAAVGLGIWLVQQFDPYSPGIWQDPHVVIGLVVFALAFFQPVLGLVHHHIFKTKGVGRRTGYAYAHVWLGRALITLGIINGGLGLRLAGKGPMQSADTTRKAEIAYGLLAGLMWLIYVVIMAWAELPRKGSKRASTGAGSGNGGPTDMWVRTSYREGNERKSLDAL
ncbi:MAG: hypothetical protein Q9160_005272 [Pyrenula sp. 1 TL-2023]